jgi:hypothetical protein
MATKKACVIFSAAKRTEADEVVRKLRDEGFEVCAAEVASDVGRAVKAGDITSVSAEVANCIDGAEVCIILVEEDASASAGMGGLAGIASDGGCRVITVGGSPEKLPRELDDIIDGHVPSADTPELIDIVNGRPDRIKPDKKPAPSRDEDRVKCQ